MRRREAGRGAVPLRASFATKRSERRQAPPGSITRPCQELADDLGVALPAFGLLARLGEAEAASLRRSQERDSLTGKRGPAPQITRDWRAERRPRAFKARAIGLALFGAPSPPSGQARGQACLAPTGGERICDARPRVFSSLPLVGRADDALLRCATAALLERDSAASGWGAASHPTRRAKMRAPLPIKGRDEVRVRGAD